jgi:NarL family two-component system response regulator YdfI
VSILTAKENGGGVIRILVAATSSVRRAGLQAIVKAAPPLRLTGGAQTLAALSTQAREFQPDVILADLDRPDPQFLRAVSSIAGSGAVSAVVALVDARDAGWTARALQAGVKAILPRDAPSEEILSAIYAAHAGLVLLDPAVSQELMRHARVENTDPVPAALDELTTREVEVLRMMADGLGNKQIASHLGISDHTVKFHISSILDKLGASSRTEAVTLGIRMGLILL